MPQGGPLSPLLSNIMLWTIAVKLKFDKKKAFRVYDEQGNFYVQTNLPSNDPLYSYLFSFADYIEVVEPEYIRECVKKKLSAMQNKYIT